MTEKINQREKLALLLVLPLIFAVGITLWLAHRTPPTVSAQNDGEVWDLRGYDFDTPIRLKGPVLHIPDALLTPDEFEARAGEAVYGYPEENAQYATSRMRVLVPDGWYAFHCYSIDYSHRLYVNGELVYEIGSPGGSFDTNRPDTGSHYLTLTPVDGVIEIVSQSSNFVHREGGGHANWIVGSAGALSDRLRPAFTANLVMGCYLALTLVHLTLFVIFRKYNRANLIFAGVCFMWFLYTGVRGPKVFSVLMPSLSWFIKFRIEYLLFPVMALLFTELIHALFPGVIQKWFRVAMAGAMGVFAIVFLFADTVFMSYAIVWCGVLFYAVIAYYIIRCAMKLRRLNAERIVFLAGAVIFLFSAAHDMLAEFFSVIILTQSSLAQNTVLVFILFSAVAFFAATARGIAESKAEENRLAVHVEIMENQLVLQREQYKRITENAEAVKSMRHDMRHQLNVLRDYGASGDLDGLNKYLSELAGGLPAYDTVYCENHAVNAVAAHYLGLAKTDGFTVKSRLDIPEDTGCVPAMDLCVILGNFLENALEACRRIERGEKFIRVRSRIDGDTISIVVSNSFDGLWNEKDGAYLSRKGGGETLREGVGLSSVRTVCEKHRGLARFEIAENVWKSSALVHMDDKTGAVEK